MPFSLNDILCGGIVPVIVSVVVLAISRRFLSVNGSNRHAASIALSIGFLVGCGLLSLVPWIPTAHWHWLPYALLVAAIVGPTGSAEGVSIIERTLLYALVAMVAGYVLVPDWEDLSPSRIFHIAAFTIYVAMLSSLLQPIAKAHTGPVLPIVLWATMMAAAIVLATSGSLRFAQLAMAMAGAIFGIVIVACKRWDENFLHGSALLFTIAAVGLMLIGRVNSFSSVPLASYLILPVAPLLTVCGTVGPCSRLMGAKRYLALTLAPLLLLAIAVFMAVIVEMTE